MVGDDITDKYLLLSNSHDGESGVQVKFTPIRVVCQNTLTMALSMSGGLRIFHTRKMHEALKLAEENLGLIRTRYDKIAESFQSMAGVQVGKERLAEYLREVFPDPAPSADETARKRVNEVRAVAGTLFDQGRGNREDKVRGTLWAAYNGVTEYVDYRAKSRTAENRLNSAWFGGGYLTKARAYRVAMGKVAAWKN